MDIKVIEAGNADNLSRESLFRASGVRVSGAAFDDDPSPVAAADPRTISNVEKLAEARTKLEQTETHDLANPALVAVANRPAPRLHAGLG
jgi:hypothetical protein